LVWAWWPSRDGGKARIEIGLVLSLVCGEVRAKKFRVQFEKFLG
jgi:hypothetical protein